MSYVGAGVRVAVLGQPQEVRPLGVRAGRRDRPVLDLGLPVVGRRQVAVGRRRVAVGLGDVGGADQPGDLAGDRGGRVARTGSPSAPAASTARCCPSCWKPIRKSAARLTCDHVAASLRPSWWARTIGNATSSSCRPPQNGVPSTRRVLRERAVGLLLVVEQEVQRAVGAGGVAVGDQRGGDLVEVARPHQVVRAATGASRPQRPRHRGRGDVGAAVASCPRWRRASSPTRGTRAARCAGAQRRRRALEAAAGRRASRAA